MNYGLNNNITRTNNINSAGHQAEKVKNQKYDNMINIMNGFSNMKSGNSVDRIKGVAQIIASIYGGQ